MTSLDELDLFSASLDAGAARVVETPKRCRRHQWVTVSNRWEERTPDGWAEVYAPGESKTFCARCPAIRDEVKARRGKQSRNYGNRAELAVARKYGGVKVGHAGGPVDVRGAEFNVQVKTHRRLPPAEWRKAFQGMNANLERIPRLLLRFLPGAGLPPDDYFVIRADDWLRWFGRDEVVEPGGDSTT